MCADGVVEVQSVNKYFAHSQNKRGDWHLLKDHLSSVARLAGDFLHGLKGEEEAYLAGLLHDLGKYGDRFQKRLLGQEKGLDHWSQGAWLSLTQCKPVVGAALAIQGHHIGLQHLNKQALRTLNPENEKFADGDPLQLSERNLDELRSRLAGDGLDVPQPTQTILGSSTAAGFARMLDVRMLFSALVDADFLDTEAHFQSDANGKHYRAEGPKLCADQALLKLLNHIEGLGRRNRAETKIAEVRRELLEQCSKAAALPNGLFTLTAPTGSGKTLAMLNFALRHAQEHNLRRIVVVLPYLSIIDQTASTYRSIFEELFGPYYVLEHHSLSGLGLERNRGDSEGREGEPEWVIRQMGLLAENWNAPLIVTTSVQMLESLMSNRPSSCRKLHHLARSVVLFDEVQTLPASLAVPTLINLSRLAREYGSTVVFATATQPAFSLLHKHVVSCHSLLHKHEVSCHASAGWQPREIVHNARAFFTVMRRADVQWEDPTRSVTWPELAQRLRGHDQVMCIVNLKRHAMELWNAMALPSLHLSTDLCPVHPCGHHLTCTCPLHQQITRDLIEGRACGHHLTCTCPLHLSTNLCPAHRRRVLNEVRARLAMRQSVRLVATQCVEAGVDIDFPVVFRAYAPLDAIIQAAGRCNREGNLAGLGAMTVFCPPEEAYPPGGYHQATDITKMLLRQFGRDAMQVDDPDLVAEYYKRLYDISRPEGALKAKKLNESATAGNFPDIAQHYRLISQDAINVVVPYYEQLSEFDFLRDEAEGKGLTADWIRRARQLTVSLYRPRMENDPIWGALEPVSVARRKRDIRRKDEWFVYVDKEHYHPYLGLVPPDSLNTLIA